MFDHAGFDVRDLRKSKAFYEKALAPLGHKCLMYSEEWKAAGFGTDHPGFWIVEGKPTNGEDDVHLCFSAKSREEVRAFYEAAIAAGGRDLGKPGPRPHYSEHYYGAFVLDPDGNNVEACCRTPE